jgi:glycosyltransferase involved in cell wall biosynthesis
LKIAILGTHGIPARYGGFETCAEEIGVRLAKRGHEITVYAKNNEQHSRPTYYEGVRLVYLPRLRHQALDYAIHGTLTTGHAAVGDADILHFFGCDHVPFSLVGRLFGKGVVLTVDGLEWKRRGYPWIYRAYLRSFAELAMVFPNATVADSRSSQRWYENRTGRAPVYIPYGTTISSHVDKSILERYGLEEDKYILFVGRLVFEKGAHTLVEAFKHIRTDLKLVLVGDSLTQTEYVQRLKEGADDRTLFLGFVYGPEFETIRNAALIYVHPSFFDGTSISLLGALGAGRAIVSSNIQENVDVGEDSVVYFERENPQDLGLKLQELLGNPASMADLRLKSLTRARKHLDWDGITDSYEELYHAILRKNRNKA